MIGADDLRQIRLLANLLPETLARLAEVVTRHTYDPGEIILLKGDPCRAAYFVAEGQVRVYRLSPEGREQVLARLGPGQTFNTVPPFHPHPANHASVAALTAATLYAISCEDFRRLVSQSDDLALAILGDFATRLDHLTNLVEGLSLHTVSGRLAHFLLEHAGEENGRDEAPAAVPRRWTQAEMATYLGTVRDVVGRTLRSFAEAGLIHLDRDRILLLDRAGLEAEAQR